MATLLTHWGRVTHICVSKLTIVGSDNGLAPDWRHAIIWTNAGILLIGPLETNLSDIFSEIRAFSLKEMHLKMSSGNWRPFCLGLNVLTPSVFHWCIKILGVNKALFRRCRVNSVIWTSFFSVSQVLFLQIWLNFKSVNLLHYWKIWYIFIFILCPTSTWIRHMGSLLSSEINLG